MNTAQTVQEKRTIRVKDFLDDVRSGATDRQLLEKYYLSEIGLAKFFEMLEERNILTAEEIRARKRHTQAGDLSGQDVSDERSSYICPCCLASHDVMFDICPSCGISFHQLISQGKAAEAKPPAIFPDQVDDDREKEPESEGLEPPIIYASEQKTEPMPTSEVRYDDNLHSKDLGASVGAADMDHDEFIVKEPVPRFDAAFDDHIDGIVSGTPLDHVAAFDSMEHGVEVVCQSCERTMEPAVRNIYDRHSSLNALFFSAVFLVLGVLAAAALTFFDGQSLQRLAVFFTAAMLILAGSVFLTVGTFLFLAREKVYRCPNCRRVFQRG